MSGLAWRIFSRYGLKSVTSVAISSSPIRLPWLALKNRLAASSEIVAENVVGGQREELLVLHHVVAQQRLADRVDHHGVRDIDMEGIFVAVLAAQRVGARADLHEQPLVALGDLHDGQRGG